MVFIHRPSVEECEEVWMGVALDTPKDDVAHVCQRMAALLCMMLAQV